MALQGPVLAASNLDRGSDEALRQGSALARHLDADFVVVHVIPDLNPARMLFPQLHQADAAGLAAIEERVGDAVASRSGDVTGRAANQYRVVIDSGSAHTGILRRAEEMGAGTIVLGPGAVAERVARHARCPVLVARPSPAGSVLAATDFSDPALPAVAMAASEAARRATGLAVVHCVESGPAVIPSAVSTYPVLPLLTDEQRDAMRKGAEEHLAASLAQVGAEGRSIVVEGVPAASIVAAARDLPATLVVVGTHGRSGFLRLALGGVAEEVLRSAPCSVLVVRLPGSA